MSSRVVVSGLADDIECNEPVAATSAAVATPVAATPTAVAPLATMTIVVMQQPAVQNNNGVWSPAKIAEVKKREKNKVCCINIVWTILGCLMIASGVLTKLRLELAHIILPLGSVIALVWAIMGCCMCCNGTCICCPRDRYPMPE